MVSFGVEFGRCGFGFEGGMFPNVRLGLVHIWWCRGSVIGHIKRLTKALADAAAELARDGK